MQPRELLKVLLIEDDAEFAGVLLKTLAERTRPVFNVDVAKSLAEGLSRLAAGGQDAVVLDLTLPDSEGLETLTKVRAQGPDVPIIVLTVSDDEALASKALQQGAQDYLVKGQADLKYLGRVIRYAIERTSAEEMLRQKQALEGINRLMMDRETRIIELKQEVNALLRQSDQPERYRL